MTKPALDIAKEITRGARQRDYAHPLLNMVRIAVRQTITHRFELREGLAINPYKATYSMVDVKLSRDECAGKQDNVVDMIGYTDMVDRMARKLIEMGYAEDYIGARTFFNGWSLPKLYEFQQELETRSSEEEQLLLSTPDV